MLGLGTGILSEGKTKLSVNGGHNSVAGDRQKFK